MVNFKPAFVMVFAITLALSSDLFRESETMHVRFLSWEKETIQKRKKKVFKNIYIKFLITIYLLNLEIIIFYFLL